MSELVRGGSDAGPDYGGMHGDIVALLEQGRRAAARSVNALMTASYWKIGRRIVEFEQAGQDRAAQGQQVLQRLSVDLERMRLFYLAYPPRHISEELSRKLPEGGHAAQSETVSRIVAVEQLALALPLSWSHYVHLVRRTRTDEERAFYAAEALRGGWSVRQLDRQISSQFYTRALLSKSKRAMLEKGGVAQAGDDVTPDAAIKDPYVLEFLNLKDEYSESQLADALTHRLEEFLLELGGDFCFVGRQRRLRIGESWFRVDLLFFHRRLLCARTNDAVARYALEGLPNKVMAAEYQTVLPDAKVLEAGLAKTRRELEARRIGRGDARGGE